MSSNITWTWKEIKESIPSPIDSNTVASSERCLFVIKNKVYDISGEDFSAWHPGGNVALTQIGRDATGAFEGFHDISSWKLLSKYCVGVLKDEEIIPPTEFEKDVQKIRAEVKKMNLHQVSASYYLTILGIDLSFIVLSFALLYYFPNQLGPLLLSSFLLGLSFQQSGWIAHDTCHHQIFSNRAVGNVFAYVVGNVLQGFSVGWWKQKHCTHHAAPNVHEHDPDIATLPYLAWSEHALEGFSDLDDAAITKFLVNHQAFTIFPLLSFARLSWASASITWNLITDQSNYFPSNQLTEQVLLAVHYIWYLGGGFLLLSPGYAILWAVMAQIFCGLFLASVFSLNHNGMPVYDSEEALNMNFYELAIRTGRNVTPSLFNNWFTGGLNFQVEHHMFPTIPRHNLPKTSEMVKELCKKHGIPYHTTGFYDGMVEIVERLSSISSVASKLQSLKDK